MSDSYKPKNNPDEPMRYQIRVKGQLHHQWTEWFDGLAITLEKNGDTLLTGSIVDQAALHGLLRKIRDLGLTLISINRVESGQSDMSSTEE